MFFIAVALWLRLPLGASCCSSPKVLLAGSADDLEQQAGFAADYGIALSSASCAHRGGAALSPSSVGNSSLPASLPAVRLNEIQIVGALLLLRPHPKVAHNRSLLWRACSCGTGRPHFSILISHLWPAGTHNSYHQAPAVAVSPAFRYSHKPLEAQLDAGTRHIELDIHWSPLKGWTIWHQPFVDPGSSCRCLRSCLQGVRAWSERNPRHVMLVVYIEPKFRFDAPGGNFCKGGKPEGLLSLQRLITSGALRFATKLLFTARDTQLFARLCFARRLGLPALDIVSSC